MKEKQSFQVGVFFFPSGSVCWFILCKLTAKSLEHLKPPIRAQVLSDSYCLTITLGITVQNSGILIIVAMPVAKIIS